MKILLTGATGHIGLSLLPKLLDTEHKITALVRKNSTHERISDQVQIKTGNILDTDSLKSAVKGKDAVIHLAASLDGDKQTLREVNVQGTDNIAAIADQAGVDKFVFTSTINSHPDIPETDLTNYETSKQQAEERLLNYGFDTTIIYPSYVWGPKDYRLTRYQFIQKVSSNVLLFPPLYSPRNYNIVHVDDVCWAIIQGLSNDSNTRNLITGSNISASHLYSELSKYKQGRGFVIPIPVPILRLMIPAFDKLYNHGYLPVASEDFLSFNDVGCVPKKYENMGPNNSKNTSEILKETYRWYQKIGLVD